MTNEKRDIARFFTSIDLLAHLDEDIGDSLSERVSLETFDEGQLLIRHGNTGGQIFFIYQGKVEVRIPDVHGEIRKRVLLSEGDVVGEISLLIDSSYGADIVAMTSVTVYCLDKINFMQMVEQHVGFAETMSDLMASRMAQNGGINRVGKYQLLGKIGEGSMATVFRALDMDLNREVALKMLKYKLARSRGFLDYFENEAQTIASLNHPNIVDVYDIIDDFSTRFIVMELLHGGDLEQHLRRDGAFDLDECRDILRQAASALEYAHGLGKSSVLHRDIKPSNIVIDRRGHVKLTDFGIAALPKDIGVGITGSPAYVAPEIVEGKPFDGRADIYSFGVTAFKLLTNSLPFSAASIDELKRIKSITSAPDIRNYCPDIDEDLATFIDRCLSRDPADRLYDWKRIGKILSLETRHRRNLNPDEIGVLIRIRSSSYQDTANHVKSIQSLLEKAQVDHSIEIHHEGD